MVLFQGTAREGALVRPKLEDLVLELLRTPLRDVRYHLQGVPGECLIERRMTGSGQRCACARGGERRALGRRRRGRARAAASTIRCRAKGSRKRACPRNSWVVLSMNSSDTGTKADLASFDADAALDHLVLAMPLALPLQPINMSWVRAGECRFTGLGGMRDDKGEVVAYLVHAHDVQGVRGRFESTLSHVPLFLSATQEPILSIVLYNSTSVARGAAHADAIRRPSPTGTALLRFL